FYQFESKFENAFGTQDVGVKTSAGDKVIAPPDFAMYSYDFVNVLTQALKAYGAKGLVKGLEQVTARGANGDERGFNEHNHEGVVDDSIFFPRFHDMRWAPVKDAPLPRTLRVIKQTG